MESDLNENFDLTSKNPTDEALRRWRKLSGIVMNPKRRFPFTANLSERMKMEANLDAEYESVNEKKIARRSTSARRARAAEVHNLSERRRRDRINEKMKALQELIPHCNKSDKASMLDEAIEYLKSLRLQVQDEESDEEGGGDKKDKPDDSEKKDKEGGGRAGEKKDKTSGELRKMGANNVYGGWFMYGPGTCAEAVLDEPKQEEWLLTVVH